MTPNITSRSKQVSNQISPREKNSFLQLCSRKNSQYISEEEIRLKLKKKGKWARVRHQLLTTLDRCRDTCFTLNQIYKSNILNTNEISLDPKRTQFFVDVRSGNKELVKKALK